MVEGPFLADGDDEAEVVDEVGEAEDDPEGHDGAQEAEDEDVFEVLLEVLLLQVVSTGEDHGREQPIEEDLFVEVEILDVFGEEHEESEDEPDEDADASFVDDVDLGGEGGTCLCSSILPSRMYRIIRMSRPMKMKAKSSMFIQTI